MDHKELHARKAPQVMCLHWATREAEPAVHTKTLSRGTCLRQLERWWAGQEPRGCSPGRSWVSHGCKPKWRSLLFTTKVLGLTKWPPNTVSKNLSLLLNLTQKCFTFPREKVSSLSVYRPFSSLWPFLSSGFSSNFHCTCLLQLVGIQGLKYKARIIRLPRAAIFPVSHTRDQFCSSFEDSARGFVGVPYPLWFALRVGTRLFSSGVWGWEHRLWTLRTLSLPSCEASSFPLNFYTQALISPNQFRIAFSLYSSLTWGFFRIVLSFK